MVFIDKCSKRLDGLTGKAKAKEIRLILEEMPGYNSGAYAEIRGWLNKLLVKSSVKSKIPARDSFAVKKQGDCQIVFVGLPSAGKSSLITALSSKQLKVAEYSFTTLRPQAVTINVQGVFLQLVDLPGLIECASQGKGLGKRVLASVRTADLIVFVLDPTKTLKENSQILEELRLANINFSNKLLVTVNKVDLVSDKNKFLEFHGFSTIQVSALKKENLNLFLEAIIKKTGFIRVYSKLDSDKPIILRKPATIKDFCLKIHKEFLSSFKNARVFGKSVK
ncbi:MAG: GTPase, partial [archaeon]